MTFSEFEYACVALPHNLYVDDASETLAEIFDRGVNDCGVGGATLIEAFVTSGMAHAFERGNPSVVAGKSSIELLEELIDHLGLAMDVPCSSRFDRTPEYWLGWILALYQAERGCRYKTIFNAASYEVLLRLYWPLHEAPEEKTFGILDNLIDGRKRESRLRTQRLVAGYSQAELAKASGVSLRSIQMYEQRNKDIDKAQVATVYRLALALGCNIEDLMEAL